ncbi:MAG TPA: DUF1905 domain-containing protein [Propionibacteriaceae bacterium]|nr:DUF1905 domain-containing protein [Propionibacteriaceae bacterium]
MEDHTFSSVLWRWEAQDAWRFVTVPADLTEEIRVTGGPPRGFGSVRVEVRVGSTTWRTSVFPDVRRDSYVLPVKRAVRDAEDLEDGDEVTATLRVLAQ